MLTDQEIIDFKVYGRTIPEISAKDCALFLWCTSSNLARALDVMRGWGFTFKTSAVWDKERTGTGLIFRNQHEVLLYGTRGSPPKPALFGFAGGGPVAVRLRSLRMSGKAHRDVEADLWIFETEILQGARKRPERETW